MERIGESKLKPRRTRGTPSYYYRNRVAIAFIVTGTAIAAAWASIPAIRRTDQKIADNYSKPSEEERDRRALFNFPAARTSRSIEQTVKERDQLVSER